MPPPAVLPFPIPDSILLLLHLHLLQCPLPEAQDPNLFNPMQYGIGDRIKHMERIAHFLVGTIDHDALKTILPMFPTKQPSDVVSFRNALIKYLDSLRLNALKPNNKKPMPLKNAIPSSARSASTTLSSRQVSSSSSSARNTSVSKPRAGSHSITTQPYKSSDSKKPTSSTLESQPFGWWWKDVPVRKSLLEECTGPKFERLLLALSIHALFTSRLSSPDRSSYLEALAKHNRASNIELFDTLKDQPEEYASLVQRMKTLLLGLSKERDNLAQKRRNIETLRIAMSSSSNGQGETSMEDVEACFKDYWDRIINKYQSSVYMDGEKDVGSTKGNHMLEWMFSIAGITQKKEGTLSPTEGDVEDKKKPRHSKRMTILPAPPLPTVAAHHSTHTEMMRRLQEEVTNLRTESVESPDLAEEGDSKRENKSGGGVFTSLMDEEANLTGLIGRFYEELEELEVILEKELGKRQEAVVALYEQQQQPAEQEKRWMSAVDQFELHYEMPISPRELPSFLQIQNATSDYASQVQDIQDALHRNILSSESAEEEEEDLLVEGDEMEVDVEANSSTMGDSDGGDRTITIHPVSKSILPTKTRIPSLMKTPKRNDGIGLKSDRDKETVESGAFSSPARKGHFISPSRIQRSSPSRSHRTPKARLQKSPSTARRGHSGMKSSPSRIATGHSPSRMKMRDSPSRITATPSFFMTPTKAKGMEELKDILPPFQSPWRSVNRSRTYWDTVTPRKSIGKGRISGHGVGPRVSGTGGKRPRSSKGRVVSSSSFIRTPLKSGKRLSSIIPPVSYAPLAFGQATPRVSLDDVYEEVVEALVKSASTTTPPLSTPSRRLLDSKNNVQRSSPFKSLSQSGRGPRTPQSPEIHVPAEDEEKRSENVSEHEWEDVLDETKLGNLFPEHTSTVRRSSAKRFGDRLSMGNATRRKSSRHSGLFAVMEDEYLDEPSFTLRDLLLKVGQDGVLGANGTFNMDLIHEAEMEGGDDSILGGL